MILFEQRIMQMMQNDISRGTDTIGGTTSQREYREHQSNEFGSDLLAISDYPKLKPTNQEHYSGIKAKNESPKQYDAGTIQKGEIVSNKDQSQELHASGLKNTLSKNNKKIVNSQGAVKR